MDSRLRNTYSTIWNIHGLSSAIGCEILSIYPEYGGYTVRKHLNRVIIPRQSAVGMYE